MIAVINEEASMFGKKKGLHDRYDDIENRGYEMKGRVKEKLERIADNFGERIDSFRDDARDKTDRDKDYPAM